MSKRDAEAILLIDKIAHYQRKIDQLRIQLRVLFLKSQKANK